MKKLILTTLGLLAFACIMPTFAKEKAAEGRIKIINNTGKTVDVERKYVREDYIPDYGQNYKIRYVTDHLANGTSREYRYIDRNYDALKWTLKSIGGKKIETIEKIRERGIYTLTLIAGRS